MCDTFVTQQSISRRIVLFNVSLSLKRLLLLFAVAATSAIYAQAQQPGKDELLPAQLNAQWKASSKTTQLEAKQISILPEAALYAEHGLRRIYSRTYTDGKSNIKVELFDLNFPANAYGLYTLSRNQDATDVSWFYQGPYLVKLNRANPGMDVTQPLLDEIKQRSLSEDSELPILPSKLPAQNKVTSSERYITGPVGLERLNSFAKFKAAINFKGGVEVAAAGYQIGDSKPSLMIVEYYTPQLASDGFAQIESAFNQLATEEKEASLLKRVGNYAIIAVNVKDKPSTQALIDEIKYAPKVYWEARKITDLPVQYRPPDPAVLEEASETANVIIRTFYWIGIMLVTALLLGVTAGSIFFYWNRWRKKKLGIEDLFSDAGGTVRLNLDDYLLSPEVNKQRLQSGDKE